MEEAVVLRLPHQLKLAMYRIAGLSVQWRMQLESQLTPVSASCHIWCGGEKLLQSHAHQSQHSTGMPSFCYIRHLREQ